MTDPVERRRRLRHDCRTQLNQIIGFSEMLHEQAEDDDLDEYVADLAKIGGAARKLLALVDELGADEPPATPHASARTPAEQDTTASDTLPGTLGFESSINRVFDTAFDLPPMLSQADETDGGELLVVDDNELNRDLLARRLSRLGYTVTTAADGRAALELIAERPFDLVLLDVMMPEISGLEVLEALRVQFSAADLPVIMATARNASEDVVEALRLGANDYVTKPLDMPVVLARVDAQLSLKRARDEVQRLHRTLATAQAKIADLADSSPGALSDLEGWTAEAADDIAAAIGVAGISVWVVEPQGPVALYEAGGDPPTARDLEVLATMALHVERDADTVVPVLGLTGELFGALVVADHHAMRHEAVARLLQSFARQLGGSLELRRAREELDDAAEHRRSRREALLADGIDLLSLCPVCGRCYCQLQEVCEADGEPLEMPAPFPYRIASRYRLVRVLGEGGMGTVYEAADERLDRVVAIKVILPEHFDDDTVRLRFENEARAVARIDHPGVISVFDSGELDDGSAYIVMEFLSGHDLGELVHHFGRGTPAQVAALLRQGASALAAAHAARILHRDIKPGNIVLVPDGAGFRTKILDFGVAKEVSTETHLTRTGTLVGTPRYMSPEQILGSDLDLRSDLYSFAAVVYEALTGRRVSLREGFAEIMMDTLREAPPRVTELRPELPAGVDGLMEQALAKRAEDRPSDFPGWAETFARLLEGLPTDEPGWRVDANDAELLAMRRDISTQVLPAPARRDLDPA